MQKVNDGYVVDAIYDNEGATIDRFSISVAFDGERKRLIRASADQSPQKGIFEVEFGEHQYKDDRKIMWDQLPEDVQLVVSHYCSRIASSI